VYLGEQSSNACSLLDTCYLQLKAEGAQCSSGMPVAVCLIHGATILVYNNLQIVLGRDWMLLCCF
jgi:hypothetical protein